MGEVEEEEAIEKYHGLVPLVYDVETMGLDESRPQDMPYAVYLKREADKVIAHQKYKRCLAMAERCKDRIDNPVERDEHDGWLIITEFWERWHKRWLELAEKFKEAK